MGDVMAWVSLWSAVASAVFVGGLAKEWAVRRLWADKKPVKS